MDKAALGALTGQNNRPIFAAFQRMFAGIEQQFALGLLWAMTLEARLFEEGLNVLGEINGARSDWGKFRNVHVRGS